MVFTDGRISTEHKGEIPDELRRAWDGNKKLSEQLTQVQKENGKLQEENAELQKRLDAMTKNFRKKAAGLHRIRKVAAERSQEIHWIDPTP